ncbi:hypothetical protein V6R21_25430 [Limibacter armeniacum]|uniref:hypothetical protein n=1 Tax=Limibacter armeniacum TaxID=466084 RepID=UPI002FE6C037
MKTTQIIKSLLFVGLFGLLFTYSCKDPLDGVQIQLALNEEIKDHIVTVQFMDANGVTTLPFQDIEVTVNGTDAASVLSESGDNNFTVNESGMLSLFVMSQGENETPLERNFTVTAKADGYLSASQNIKVVGSGQQSPVIKMVNLTTTPQGVGTTASSFNTSSTGATSTEISFSATTDNLGSAQVTIPSGTIMKDSNGNPVSGALHAQLTYFSPTSTSSLEAFPGGLSNIALQNQSGEFEFETAGLFALEISSGSQLVKTFSAPITVVMEIPAGTPNPDNNFAAIKAGDTIPLWSLSEGETEWADEGSTTVYEEGGKLYAKLSITHLSYYNLDWVFNACPPADITIQIDEQFTAGKYLARFYNATTGRYQKQKYLYIANNEVLSFYNAPSAFPIKVELYRNYSFCNTDNVTPVAVSASFNACQSQTLSFTVTDTGLAQQDLVSFDLSAVCPNDPNVLLYPNANIYFKSTDCGYYQFLGNMEDGKLTTDKLEIGQDYQFFVYVYVAGRYAGYRSFTYTVSSSEITQQVEIPEEYAEDVCF